MYVDPFASGNDCVDIEKQKLYEHALFSIIHDDDVVCKISQHPFINCERITEETIMAKRVKLPAPPVVTAKTGKPLNYHNKLFSHTRFIQDSIPDLPVILGSEAATDLDPKLNKIVERFGKEYYVLLEHTEAGTVIRFYTHQTFPSPKYLPRDTVLVMLDLKTFLTQWKLMSKDGVDITSTWNPTMGDYEGSWNPICP